MNKEILKFCKKHGDLVEGQVRWEKSGKNGTILRCIQCKIEKDMKWKKNNREKHNTSACRARNEARRLYRLGLTKVKAKADIWGEQDRKNNPEKYKEWAKIGRERAGIIRTIKEITRLRGIKLQDYYEMVGNQNNKCAICDGKEKRKNRNGDIARLCIDHNHKTGYVRGLLCHGCNQVIGHSRESIDILKKAITYIEKHEHVRVEE